MRAGSTPAASSSLAQPASPIYFSGVPRIPKPELYPSGGFYFTESDGSVHTSSSWSLVIEKVRAYRELTGKEPGNPQDEVFAQACERNPDICGEPGGKPFVHDPRVKLGVEVQNWIAGVSIENARKRITRVGEAEASRRAVICRGCPMNSTWQSACAPCSDTIVTLTKDLTREGPGVSEEGLYGCLAHFQINSIAVRLDLPSRDNPAAPENCWRKSA